MSDEERRASAAAAGSSAGTNNGDLGMSTDDDLSPTRNADGGLHPTVGPPDQAVHRTSWLRMRTFLVRPSIFLILRPQFKICVARVRPWGKFLIQNFVIHYFYFYFICWAGAYAP